MKKTVLTAVGLILLCCPAFAHEPIVLPHDTTTLFGAAMVKPIEKSVAYYATFDYNGDVDRYNFSLTASDLDPNNASLTMTDLNDVVHNLVVTAPDGKPGRKLHVGSLVPGCGVYKGALPTIAIVGPRQSALPAYTGTPSKPSSVYIGSSEGVKFITNSTQGPLWYEKFTYKSYYDQKKANIILTKAGNYRIYVWNPKTMSTCSSKADYVLEIGDIEVFGLPEIMDALFWLEHLVNDGEISCSTCKDQLKTLDGPNPTIDKIIADYAEMFM